MRQDDEADDGTDCRQGSHEPEQTAPGRALDECCGNERTDHVSSADTCSEDALVLATLFEGHGV